MSIFSANPTIRCNGEATDAKEELADRIDEPDSKSKQQQTDTTTKRTTVRNVQEYKVDRIVQHMMREDVYAQRALIQVYHSGSYGRTGGKYA